MGDGPRVVTVGAEVAHPLRLSVLRDGTPDRNPGYPGDDDPTTRHYAVRAGGRLAAVSTWIVAPFPPEPHGVGLQLRGMATEPACRGLGYATLLLAAGRGRARELGTGLVWARARTTALGFYLTHGFIDVGGDFIDETSGLPHRLVRSID